MNEKPKFDFRFLKQILVTAIIVVALVSYPLFEFATEEIITASVIGFVLSVMNALLGYAAIEFSANKSYTHFTQIVLGGIAVRLFLMAGILLALIWLVKVHALALVVSLFGMYVIFLALEVLYIHYAWQKK